MNDRLQLQLPIATPPWTKLGKKLESTCRKALFEYEMLEGVQKLAIALSGGKDSLTLLYLLHAINGRGIAPFEIEAIHLSGNFSCGPSLYDNYLKKICEKLQITLHIVTSDRTLKDLECYSCSRERRKKIFTKAKEIGASTIAFGHHLDDNVETTLMNLLHKAEFAGNLPKIKMFDYGITIIRPLIYVTEEEIRSFAKMYHFERITCMCPVGQDSLRRKTKELLAKIEEIYPNARINLAKAIKEYGSNKALVK